MCKRKGEIVKVCVSKRDREREKERKIDRWTDTRMDRWMDGWIDRYQGQFTYTLARLHFFFKRCFSHVVAFIRQQTTEHGLHDILNRH